MNFFLNYGSGQVSGTIARDTISLITDKQTFSLHNTTFGEITNEDSKISSFHMDGVCGLAFSGLSTVTKPSLIESLFSTYSSMNRSFSIYLNSNPKDTIQPSFISFGSSDLSIVGPNAKFYYTPVIRYSSRLTYWAVSLTGFRVSVMPSEGSFSLSGFLAGGQLDDSLTALSLCTYRLQLGTHINDKY